MRDYAILLIPFLGTSFGAAMVFFMKEKLDSRLEKLMMGFASGVMIAASVWSLLLPAISMVQEQGGNAWFPAATGFLSGVGFLLLLDRLVPVFPTQGGTNTPGGSGAGGRSRFRMEKRKQEGKVDGRKTAMLALAVTLHNLPEGMAVGVAFAGAMTENTGMTMAGVLVLAIGIGVQNFPEGAIISMPLKNTGVSRAKAFWYGVLSGAVEPMGAVVTILLAEQAVLVLPYLLAFAAGAMIYVVVDELIPGAETGEHTCAGTVGAAMGFVVMMVLDVALG